MTAIGTTEPPEDVDIDPRIEARRVSVRREHARRRGRILIIVASIVVVVVGVYVVINSALLDVDHVEVQGARHISAEQVRAGSGVRTGRPLLRVDLGVVAQRVEQLPWVVRAHVTRHFPNTIRIEVVEGRPVAYVRQRKGVALIAVDGRVLATGARLPAHLVAITGVTRVAPLHHLLVPGGLAAVVRAIPAQLRPHVRELAVGRSSLVLRFDRGELRLGNASAPGAKFAAAVAVINTFGGRPFQYVDVSVPSDPVARL